jgi:hypothetical protein
LGVVLRVESSVRAGPAVTSEDAKLAKLAKAGDTAAYERLVRNHLGAAFRNFLGLSEAETAATLGCALGTVKSRLSRAIGGLRKRMEEATARQTRRGLLAGGQRNANLSRRARAATELLPGGALLWEHEGRALLMRTELPKAEAIQLAASVS